MAWNEPGKGKDPWGGGNRNNGGGGDGGGPPDLDQIWKRFRERFSSKRGGGNGGSGGVDPVVASAAAIFLALMPIVFVIWLATGLYVVQPGEKGVVLRLGAVHPYHRRRAGTGICRIRSARYPRSIHSRCVGPATVPSC